MNEKINLLELFEYFENERQYFPLLDVFQKFKATDYSGAMKGTSKNRCFQLNIGSGALQFPFVLIS